VLTIILYVLTILNVVSIGVSILFSLRYNRKRKEILEAVEAVQEAEHNRLMRKVGIIQMQEINK